MCQRDRYTLLVYALMVQRRESDPGREGQCESFKAVIDRGGHGDGAHPRHGRGVKDSSFVESQLQSSQRLYFWLKLRNRKDRHLPQILLASLLCHSTGTAIKRVAVSLLAVGNSTVAQQVGWQIRVCNRH